MVINHARSRPTRTSISRRMTRPSSSLTVRWPADPRPNVTPSPWRRPTAGRTRSPHLAPGTRWSPPAKAPVRHLLDGLPTVVTLYIGRLVRSMIT
jgi:hypothetical protein